MKLSEAGVLGDCLKINDINVTLSFEQARYCGCWLGGALLADGYKRSYGGAQAVNERWPWFTLAHWIAVSKLHQAGKSVEAIADYVRSIEPECGDCNEYKCICNKVIKKEENIYVNVSK